MAEVAEGRKAPDFKLQASTDDEIRLKDFRGKSHVVLYFYPRDMTSGCTLEAQSFRDLHADFANADAVVLGVSTDDLDRHGKFADKEALNFPLLSDTDAKVAARYGVWRKKKRYGREFMGIERTTFVIDREGTIRKIYPKVKVQGHAQEVLDFVRTLG
jgi:peroxiredoxin Q/BCP